MATNSSAKLHPDCVTLFNEFKGNSNIPTHDFLTMKLDGIDIVLDLCPQIGTSSNDDRYKNSAHPAFDHMVDHLLTKGSGYAFFIFPIHTSSGARSKIVFITYIDDNAPVKTKMTMTSSKSALEKGCPGFGIKIQANCREDITYESVLQAVSVSKSS